VFQFPLICTTTQAGPARPLSSNLIPSHPISSNLRSWLAGPHDRQPRPPSHHMQVDTATNNLNGLDVLHVQSSCDESTTHLYSMRESEPPPVMDREICSARKIHRARGEGGGKGSPELQLQRHLSISPSLHLSISFIIRRKGSRH
jgi:hypothetical protein